jgi:hypothetical protein
MSVEASITSQCPVIEEDFLKALSLILTHFKVQLALPREYASGEGEALGRKITAGLRLVRLAFVLPIYMPDHHPAVVLG